MFRFFSKNIYEIEPDAFGLDVSDESFKFIQLRQKKHVRTLSAFGSGGFPKDLIVDGEIKKEDEVVGILKAALGKPQFGSVAARHVVCSLPEEHSFTRVVQLPKMDLKEAGEAIMWEIEQNIPMSINDVYYDWQPVDFDQKNIPHQDILISAAPKKLVDGYMSVMKKCGLVVKSLEVESVAVSRALVKGLKTDGPVLLIDMGATRTSFIIFSGSTLQFTSSIPLAGKKMIGAIAAAFSVNEEEARKLFFDVGLDKAQHDGKVYATLEPIIRDLAEQIRSYVSFYESHSAHEHQHPGAVSVQKVLLSGGVSNLNGLNVYLALALRIPVETGNPWVNILQEPLREVPELPYRKSLGYTTALGLALSGIQKSR